MSDNNTIDAPWWKKGVFYQVYPRSYMDRNGDGIGDLAGITDKLKYIANLGVDGIWISPFFASPMADFGYDVSDYRSVDPMFGTNEDFDALLHKAQDLGMKVIIDMVLSHTSKEHAWFQESRIGKDNRKADWYVWADAKPDGSPPNNWQSLFGGSAWTFDTKRGQYYMHNFLSDQPDLNFHCDAVQKQMLSECEYWLERGVNGFRLDTVNFYVHDKELRDNPPRSDGTLSTGVQVEAPYPYTMQNHVYDKSQPENLEFLRKLRDLMNRYDDIMAIGEMGDDDPFKLAADYTEGDDFIHTNYLTHLMQGTSAGNLDREHLEFGFKELAKHPHGGWPSWAFSNHDMVRTATRWGKGIKDKDGIAVLFNKMLLSLRGTPFIYQGEELGLPEAIIPFEKLQDPWGINMWPEWQGRDGCRTPMPWDSTKDHAGFSTTDDEPWLPIPSDHADRAVNLQEADPHSVLNQTRAFIAWRKSQPILQLGEIDFIDTEHDNIIGFNRSLNGKEMLCLFNISEDNVKYKEIELEPLGCIFKEA